MEENSIAKKIFLIKKELEKKGYKSKESCKVCQIWNWEIEESELPDLKKEERIGVVKKLGVGWRKNSENKSASTEKFISGGITWEKFTEWYKHVGIQDEFIIILKKSSKTIASIEELREININFIGGKDEPTNRHRRNTLIIGVAELFKMNESKKFCWEWDIFLILNNESTGESASTALVMALYSAYLKKPIPLNLAATGIVDKSGNITKIGSLKEKIIAGLENRTSIFILPKDNYKNEIPLSELKKIKEIYPVSNCRELKELIEKGFYNENH
jgi:hypothetical protein